MRKCEICSKEAEFVAPADLCEWHWELWWYSGVFQDNHDELPKDMTQNELKYLFWVKRGKTLDIDWGDEYSGKTIVYHKGTR